MNKVHDENELLQYYIVNKDLEMSPGKIAGQVAHVCRRITDWYKDCSACGNSVEFLMYTKWVNDYSEKKIILEAHQKTLEKLKEDGFFYVQDNGLTEIAQGSLTCVGLGVMTRKEAQPFIKRLQLLK